MTRISRALGRATQQLRRISDSPRLDAELLMAAALDIGRDRLLLEMPASEVPEAFAGFVDRRLTGEPIAYITGHRGFWNIDLEVGPGALVPRPDSETLIAAAVEHFAGSPGPNRIVDLGTGPGTLLLAALDEWPKASGLGIDASESALAYANRNAQRIGLADRSEFRVGDWAQGISEQFDLILCNPPYVATEAELGPGVAEHEPHEALFAGEEGLEAYRVLAPQLPGLLAPGGIATVEIGFDQAEVVSRLLAISGLQSRVSNDLAGHPRCILLTWG